MITVFGKSFMVNEVVSSTSTASVAKSEHKALKDYIVGSISTLAVELQSGEIVQKYDLKDYTQVKEFFCLYASVRIKGNDYYEFTDAGYGNLDYQYLSPGYIEVYKLDTAEFEDVASKAVSGRKTLVSKKYIEKISIHKFYLDKKQLDAKNKNLWIDQEKAFTGKVENWLELDPNDVDDEVLALMEKYYVIRKMEKTAMLKTSIKGPISFNCCDGSKKEHSMQSVGFGDRPGYVFGRTMDELVPVHYDYVTYDQYQGWYRYYVYTDVMPLENELMVKVHAECDWLWFVECDGSSKSVVKKYDHPGLNADFWVFFPIPESIFEELFDYAVMNNREVIDPEDPQWEKVAASISDECRLIVRNFLGRRIFSGGEINGGETIVVEG